MAGHGVVAGHDGETGAFENPPRAGKGAIGEKAVMDNVRIVFSFSPFAFEIKRIGCGVQAGAGLNGGGGRALHVIESSVILVQIVLDFIAIELLAPGEVFEMDMASGFDVSRIGV